MSAIETSITLLRGFAEDVAAGEDDYPEDMVEVLKGAATFLTIAAGLSATKVTPPIINALTSEKGVSFTKVAAMVPAFCEDMGQRIAARQAEAEQAGVVRKPLVDVDDDNDVF
ncbi:hypothetical protein LPN04_31060 [Rugamonas sp. A1-17]|nr:hypothetical protein [Rugamonas sp. A1-17]